MVFGPHRGHLAPRHRAAGPLSQPADARAQTVSVYAAWGEAWELFTRAPLTAILVGLVWGALLVAAWAPAMLVDGLSHEDEDTYMDVVGTAAVELPVEVAMFGATFIGFAVIGSPVLIGVYASAIRSAREGMPTTRGLLSGFAQFPHSLGMGLLALLVMTVLGCIPLVGWLFGIVAGTYWWMAMSALADRRRGIRDALRTALTIVTGRLFALILLQLVAGLALLLGCALAFLGLVVTVPVMVLMLGIGYRDAAQAAGVAPAQ